MIRLTKWSGQAVKKSEAPRAYPRIIENIRHGEIGSKLFPRPGLRDEISGHNTDKFLDTQGTIWKGRGSGSVHKNQTYEDDDSTTIAGGTFERNWRDGPWHKLVKSNRFARAFDEQFQKTKQYEQGEFMKYVEYTGRGWVKPELMRAMYIVEYGHIHHVHGTAQNPDPFRHFEYDVIRTGDHKYRSIDVWMRRLRDAARDSQEAFCKVHAASFNPHDYYVSQGYGWAMLEFKRIGWNRFTSMIMPWRRFSPTFDEKQQRDLMVRLGEDRQDRKTGNENYDPAISVFDDHRFPLVLGRDFVGTLEDMGGAVGSALIDDRVWGVRAPHQQGCICDYRQLKAKQFSQAPMNISLEECAAIPYVGVSLLQGFDDKITPETTRGKQILVIGGTGGSGTLAIQLLKGWGGHVSTICNSNASQFMTQNTPVDEIFHYDTIEEDETVLDQFKGRKFDLVLNCSDNENEMYKYIDIVEILGDNAWYITMNTTMWERYDSHAKQSRRFYSQTQTDVARDHSRFRNWFKKRGKNARWAAFIDTFATYELDRLRGYVEEGYIKPVVTKTVPIADAIPAFQEFVHGNSRGKTIVTVDDKC